MCRCGCPIEFSQTLDAKTKTGFVFNFIQFAIIIIKGVKFYYTTYMERFICACLSAFFTLKILFKNMILKW